MTVPVHFVARAEIERIRAAVKDPYLAAQALAQACRINTLSMIMYAGSGHIGTSFSSMDLLCWLWTRELREPAATAAAPGELYFSSKGHDVPGLYAVLIALGRLDESYLTQLRRLNGLPGHPDVATPYMITNTGPLGMGISKARGMIHADRLDGRRGRVFVLTGDGELQEGQFWESLQPTANGKFAEITAVIDHNKLQSDTFVSDVSDLGDLSAKLSAFGFAVARCDGHDFRAIEAALAQLARGGDRPRILIADTVKGKGVSFMEGPNVGPDKQYKFHSGAPSPEHYAAGIEELARALNAILSQFGAKPVAFDTRPCPPRWNPEGPERQVNAYAEELVALARKHPEIIALDGDLALDTGVLPFKREFPERFIECGIAEQDMVSQAGALALKGKLPVVHSFACFLSTRPNEQIYNNATERTKVIYHASLAGLLPAAPGHSHQSVRDISAVGSVPGLTLIHPANEQATRLALRWAVENNPGSTYLRLTTVPCAIPFKLPESYALVPGRGTVLRSGRDGVIIAYGPVMLSEAFRAAEALEQRGRSLAVVDMPWLNRVDEAWLAELLRDHERLFLVEDHYPELGQSAFIAQAMCRAGIAIKTRIYGVDEIPICAQVPDALEYHGLSAKRLAERIGAEL